MKKALPLAVCMLPGRAGRLWEGTPEKPSSHPDCLRRVGRRFRDRLTRGGKNNAQR